MCRLGRWYMRMPAGSCWHLVEPGEQLIICRGGRGGRGNSVLQTRATGAKDCRTREPGEERSLRLELRLIADVGIVGVPNAGKSTFLSAVSKLAKIAAYPFTTLEPNLGVAVLDEDKF